MWAKVDNAGGNIDREKQSQPQQRWETDITNVFGTVTNVFGTVTAVGRIAGERRHMSLEQ